MLCAGATQTGTHGSSLAFGSLSTLITHFQLVIASGEVMEADAKTNPDLFNAGRVVGFD